MSKRLHHFTLLLVYSLFASFQRNSDEEEGSPLSFTSPAHPTRTPDHLPKRLLNLEKTFSALTHASFLFCFVFLNQSGGCAQSGCSCLRDPSRNIWTPSTLVFLPLRTVLMRRSLGSFPRTGHSARMHFLSVKITTKKKKSILWSQQRLHHLELFLQADAHVCVPGFNSFLFGESGPWDPLDGMNLTLSLPLIDRSVSTFSVCVSVQRRLLYSLPEIRL